MKPVIVSFYAGDKYYYDCADKLKANCDRLGLEHSIEELEIPKDFDWANVCRLKVQFYKRKLEELQKPILWVDVDSEINFLPEFMDNSGVDFSAFLRGFRDLSNFNPLKFQRFWAPSFLFFNYTDGGRAFVNAMAEAETDSPKNATDDYFLEEAWRQLSNEIVALPIPRKFLSLRGDNEGAAFVFGDSGNVADFKGKVDQHDNVRAGDYIAELALSWSASVTNSHFKKYLYGKASEYPVSDLDVLLKLARAGERLKMPQHGLKYAVRAAYLYPRKYESRLIMHDLLLKLGRDKEAREVLVELANCEYDDWRNLAVSRLLDFDRDKQIEALEAEDPDFKPIEMWWAKTPMPGNIGDILNPYIIERLTGTPPKFVERGKGMLAIGSIIKWAKDDCHVWGSGTSRYPETLNPMAVYNAVRGPLTRKAVMENGGYCPEVYGDAALLLPLFYKPNVRKQHKVGFIPHYQHHGYEQAGDYKFIDILGVTDADIERLIDEICSCEYIISTSLHGIIIANAYGVPARWATISDAEKHVHGDNTKFKDYFLGVGLPVQEPLDLAGIEHLDHKVVSKGLPKRVTLKFDPKRLIKAFPYQDRLLEKYRP